MPNPDHVGFYFAQNKGYFSKQNLTVNFRVPSSAADPLKLVGLNKADLAVSYEPEMFYGQQEGLPVVAVAAVVPVPLNGLIVSPKIPVTGLCQIRGHSVGFTGLPSDFAFYDTLLHTCHLSAKQVPHQSVGYNLVPSILSGKVDAIIGGYRNVEAIQISQEMNKRAADFPANELGVPNYDELVLVANAHRLVLGSGLRELRQAFRRRAGRRNQRGDEGSGRGHHDHEDSEPVHAIVPPGERPLHAQAAGAKQHEDGMHGPQRVAKLRKLDEDAQAHP